MATEARPTETRANPLAALGRGGTLAALGRGGLRWLPVAIALGLFAQLALRGLRPALAERTRLEHSSERLDERLQEDGQQRSELAAFREALDDPIYQERLRLKRLESGAKPAKDSAKNTAEGE